jgi:hypothetical protein
MGIVRNRERAGGQRLLASLGRYQPALEKLMSGPFDRASYRAVGVQLNCARAGAAAIPRCSAAMIALLVVHTQLVLLGIRLHPDRPRIEHLLAQHRGRIRRLRRICDAILQRNGASYRH